MEEEKVVKKNIFSRWLRSYRSLPQKKQYVEFFTAILTVPVLLTVIILNVSSLRNNEKPKDEPKDTQKQIVITIPSQPNKTEAKETPTATPQACKKEIGPIEITSPQEGDTVKANPVSITVDQSDDGYCSVVWSYRVNGGSWSDYDDKSIAIYNPPKWNITLELRVKSLVSKQEKTLMRKFTYDGPDNSASSSGALN